jgi:hypothetical protein
MFTEQNLRKTWNSKIKKTWFKNVAVLEKEEKKIIGLCFDMKQTQNRELTKNKRNQTH